MKNKISYANYTYLLTIILLLLLVFFPALAETLYARPGGGHSYSGGGGGGGYSGGGGDGDLGIIILILAQLPPQISIPLIIIIVAARVYQMNKNKKQGKTVSSTPTSQNVKTNNQNIENQINTLKNEDAYFSKILFLDFASSIYKKYFSLYGKQEFKNLAPFLPEGEVEYSANAPVKQGFTEIVIGNIKISSLQFYPDIIGIAVDIDSNFSRTVNNKKTRYSVTERWYFNRKRGILSADPDKMHKLSCPNCGASSDFTDAGVCNSCNTFIEKGEMQWYLKNHKVLNQETLNTSGITHYALEQGTNLPTVFQHNLQDNIAAFANRHKKDFEIWKNSFLNEVAATYFFKIYEAWSSNNLGKARNLLSDRLYESFMFWIQEYKSLNLTNRLEKISIKNIIFCSIESDKYYESITLRIYAEALDYVTDRNNKVVGGSNQNPRKFSEYWTFIRRSGVEKDSFDYDTCPSCGAPADKIGMAGVCEYCGTKISNGDFSWILAIITQDEVYTG